MKLSTVIPLDGDGPHAVTYLFEPSSGEHVVRFGFLDGQPVSFVESSRGGVVNHLVPFRGNEDVDALISWLSR